MLKPLIGVQMTEYQSGPLQRGRVALRTLGTAVLLFATAACTSLGASGPTSRSIHSAADRPLAGAAIKIINVNEAVAREVLAAERTSSFSDALGDAPPIGSIIGRGDVLGVTIWEAPPAALFGSQAAFGANNTGSLLAATAGMGEQTALPEMMVDSNGTIQVPFAGSVPAAGRTPEEVQREIVRRLTGKAHDPQVIVRIVQNANSTVTVVGDVAENKPVTLTPRGERLLDVLAASGGVKQPVGKTTIQITRGDRVVSLPLETVIKDPSQNIRLASGDVVTALFQPFSFISLGATGTSAEIPFESTGLTLSQALGRIGGLRDDRANVRGVFIFRLENPAAVDPAIAATARRTPDGRIPVIYRVDLGDPASFFVAQSFPIRNKDVLYVSSAPLADLQKFVSIVSSMAFSVIGITNSIP
jgi:polysaccharide export outer membrane protein